MVSAHKRTLLSALKSNFKMYRVNVVKRHTVTLTELKYVCENALLVLCTPLQQPGQQ